MSEVGVANAILQMSSWSGGSQLVGPDPFEGLNDPSIGVTKAIRKHRYLHQNS